MKPTWLILFAAGLLTGCEKPTHIRLTDRRGSIWYIKVRDVISIEPVGIVSGLTNSCLINRGPDRFPIILDYDSDEAARRIGLR